MSSNKYLQAADRIRLRVLLYYHSIVACRNNMLHREVQHCQRAYCWPRRRNMHRVQAVLHRRYFRTNGGRHHPSRLHIISMQAIERMLILHSR